MVRKVDKHVVFLRGFEDLLSSTLISSENLDKVDGVYITALIIDHDPCIDIGRVAGIIVQLSTEGII